MIMHHRLLLPPQMPAWPRTRPSTPDRGLLGLAGYGSMPSPLRVSREHLTIGALALLLGFSARLLLLLQEQHPSPRLVPMILLTPSKTRPSVTRCGSAVLV